MRKKESKKTLYLNSLYNNLQDDFWTYIRNSAPVNVIASQIDVYEGAMLKFFAKIIDAKKILEIGTCVGYSAMWLCDGMSKDGIMISIEKNSHNYNITLRNIKEANLQDKIILVNDDALSFLEWHYDIYDLIFIDGKKDQYPRYLKHAARLLRKGGILIADNTLLFDNLYDDDDNNQKFIKMKKAMEDFNQAISSSDSFDFIIIPTDSGMTVACKK